MKTTNIAKTNRRRGSRNINIVFSRSRSLTIVKMSILPQTIIIDSIQFNQNPNNNFAKTEKIIIKLIWNLTEP